MTLYPSLITNPNGTLTFSGEGTFLECVAELNNGNCVGIFGPFGGILVINQGGLTYRDGRNIFFSPEAYLKKWKMISKFGREL